MKAHTVRLVVDHQAAGDVLLMVDDIVTVLQDYTSTGARHSGLEEFADGSRSVAIHLPGECTIVFLQGGSDSVAYRERVLRIGRRGAAGHAPR